jgi:predicted phosphohydrolase
MFGPHWKDHHLKVEVAWRASIAADDIVLVAGDLSWAMRAQEIVQDLRWLAALPGEKVLIKGNHDYWWPGSQTKLKSLLPAGVHAIKKRAILLDGVAIIGVRGADFFLREGETAQVVEERLVRERNELLQSVEDLARLAPGGVRPVCMFHYPPFPVGRSESAFTRILEDVGCTHCVYGHLHTQPEWLRVFQGEARGVRYRLVSCDALDFKPVCIVGGESGEDGEGREGREGREGDKGREGGEGSEGDEGGESGESSEGDEGSEGGEGDEGGEGGESGESCS